MSLVQFERYFDRLAPAFLLFLGFVGVVGAAILGS
jgi:hypothetical protein